MREILIGMNVARKKKNCVEIIILGVQQKLWFDCIDPFSHAEISGGSFKYPCKAPEVNDHAFYNKYNI